ncbi:MFS transporter [Actinoplanes sp. KI2]|uniref:MFS transporter n=1 Tax=Actinoplanes sp. KI2 TaxID=2983315 RepID=UPI0021D5D6B1|nr:MFS transporter [Actinoplanes sp. KI2]MCU7728516.1 MFS transporter [Actinoplanes sp. KI2]
MTSSVREQTRTRAAWALLVLCLVQFVDVMGVTSAVVAIPSIIRGVHASGALAAPLATAYAMFFGGLLVLGARLAHKYGHRRLLVAGLVVFAVAGGIGWAARYGWQLVLARSVQGTASALTVPAALSLLLATASRADQRARALGWWSAAGAAAGASGLFLGGYLTDTVGWRAVFWVNIPVALLLGAGVIVSVHARPQADRSRYIDVVGALLLTASVMAMVFGAALLQEPAHRAAGASAVAAGVLLAGLLVLRLARSKDPILPLGALRQPRLAAGSLGSFVNTAATSSTAVLLTIHAQETAGLSALQAGLMLLPLSLSVVPGSVLAGPIMRRWGARRTIVLGLALLALGNAVVALTLDVVAGTVTGLALLGYGLGTSSVACNDLGTKVPQEHVSTATGVLNTAAQLGTALGVAALILVASAEPAAGGRGSVIAMLIAAAGAVAALAAISRRRSNV